MIHLFEEYSTKFENDIDDLINVFKFLDKGLEIDTNDLENPEVKALMLKIFSCLNIENYQPGIFRLKQIYKKFSFSFYKLFKYLKKENYEKILEFINEKYPASILKRTKLEVQDETQNDMMNEKEQPIEINETKKNESDKMFNDVFGLTNEQSVKYKGKYDHVLQKGGMRNFALEQIRASVKNKPSKESFEIPIDRLVNSNDIYI